MKVLAVCFVLFITAFGLNAQMTLSGTATGACDCYTVTDAANQAGSVWSPSTIDLSNPFDFTFTVNLGANDVWGADGMTFAMRQSGTTTGGIGNELGYGGISNSFAVEIDTWNSSPAVPADIASDHLAMSSSGGVNHDLVAAQAIANIEDGLEHFFRIVWDPVTFDLEIILDGTSVFTYNGDLVTLFFGGTSDVYFGWTGGTGGVSNIQSVCMYRDAEFSTDVLEACVGQEITFTDESTGDLKYNGNDVTSWTWDFGDATVSSDQNPAHTYTTTGVHLVSLTVTDPSGCTSTETLAINVTPSLDIDMSAVNIACFGANDGTATATPVTGTGPYDYSWNDPLLQTTQTAIGLSTGMHVVNVVDDLGCVGADSILIMEAPELIFGTISTTNAGCGAPNGTITVAASGGTGTLEFSKDGGVTYQATGSFTGLANGDYTVFVRDANGCTINTIVTVGLDSPLSIDGVVTTPMGCGPVDDGTLTVAVSSGVFPYDYSIDGMTYTSSNTFTGLDEGTYTVEVVDGAGCSVTTTAVVGTLSTVSIDMVAVTTVSCNGSNDGVLTISASGGTGSYDYSINGGTTYSSSGTFSGLSGGDYDIEVQDALGCRKSELATITEPSAITIDAVDQTNVSCNGLSDGEFELTVSGGVGGYEFSNNAGVSFSTLPMFAGLVADVYNVEVRDVDGCTISDNVTITQPSVLNIDGITVQNVSCNGLADGEIEVSASGGTIGYQYRVNAGTYQVSNSFTGLIAGSYVIDVIDVNECLATLEGVITENDPLVISLGADTTICSGGAATLCPTTTGGIGPYTYSWDAETPVIDPCLVTTTLGLHELQVTDANGCLSNEATQSVFQYEPLSVFSSSSATVCPGDDVLLTGEAGGEGPAGYSYEWTNSVDATVLIGPIHTVNPDVTTTYTLTVSVGCENTASTDVVVNTYYVPMISIMADDSAGCQSFEVNLTNLTDPVVVAQTTWDLGDGTTATGATVNHIYTDPNCNDINVMIETVDGCFNEQTFDDFICVWQRPVADFSYTPTMPDLFHLTVDFENETDFASNYVWSFGDGTGSSIFEPSHTFPEIGNQTYTVDLLAVSDRGCEDRISKKVKVEEIVLFYIPNAFTPNVDPLNQTFDPVFIPGFFPADYSFKVFNRWGELIFESQNPTVGWDGTYNAIIAVEGTYTWQITFRENSTDVTRSEFGHFLLMR